MPPLSTKAKASQAQNVRGLDSITILNLEGWLRGDFGLDDLIKHLDGYHDPGNIMFALEISDPVDVHLSCDISAQSFEIHSRAVKDYIEEAAAFTRNAVPPGWAIPTSFSRKIVETIGNAPATAHPIYFISSESDTQKEIVYVGRTAAQDGRFRGGHHAITKLHAPAYDGTVKRVYMASALVRTHETEWINVEMIRPFKNAEHYLSEIELNLIYSLQPALNDQGKTELGARIRHPVEIRDRDGLVPWSDWVWPTEKQLGQ